MDTVILLTGCINPDGMPFTKLTDICERKIQYEEAIRFYLKETNLKIVYCDNSGIDISSEFQEYIDKGVMEFLSFHGNKNKQKGKGYGECEIIDYAIKNSSFINSNIIIKITGRIKVLNIKKIILNMAHSRLNNIICTYNSKFDFVDSRIFIAPVDFYHNLLRCMELIDDYKGYFLEHIISQVILNNKQYLFYPFSVEPVISGISGTFNSQYKISRRNRLYRILYKINIQELIIRFNKLSPRNYGKRVILSSYLKMIFNKFILRIIQ